VPFLRKWYGLLYALCILLDKASERRVWLDKVNAMASPHVKDWDSVDKCLQDEICTGKDRSQLSLEQLAYNCTTCNTWNMCAGALLILELILGP